MMHRAAESSNTLLYWSLFGFAVISWLLWKFVLAPTPRAGASSTSSSSSATATATATRAASSARTGGTSAAASAPRRAAGPSSSSRAAITSKESDDDSFVFGQPRLPPHVVAPPGWKEQNCDLSGCLVRGVVPFRSTPAAGYETRLQRERSSGDLTAEDKSADLIVTNRRERARVFARMFAGQKGARPPNRGANIAVTVQHTDAPCPKLQKALFLLGTYYNLFLLIDGSGAAPCTNDEEVRKFIKQLRSELLNQGMGNPDSTEYKLNRDVLPPHRIAFASTSKGRVAFVRQLHGTELVVDCDEDVTKELQRFGFRVLAYPKNGEGGSSALGDFLCP